MILDHLPPEEASELATLAMDCLIRGEVVIMPLRVGMGYLGISDAALGRIFELKRRSQDKPLCLLANEDIARQITDPDGDCFRRLMYIIKLGIPVTVIVKPRKDIRLPMIIEQVKTRGLALYFDGGILSNAILELANKGGILLFGSSANISGQGNVFSWSELDESLLRNVTRVGSLLDVKKELDQGSKFGATIVNASDGKIIRRGLAARRIEEALLDLDLYKGMSSLTLQ
jgi:tRNA A37 threonylcarbamoyladenosine synthetase subunit TsaC/SUA5/YrdC